MPTATAFVPFSARVMPPVEFIQRLTERGLQLRCDSGKLILLGSRSARTDRIRTYLRTQKSTLIAFLSDYEPLLDPIFAGMEQLVTDVRELDREAEAQARAGEECQCDGDDPEYGDQLRAAYEAAKSGLMPSGERVQLAPGNSTDNPGGCFLAAVARARRIRPGRSHAEYLAATIQDRATVEAIALWWHGLNREKSTNHLVKTR